MIADDKNYNEQMALLLDRPGAGADLAAARDRLQRDSAFRADFESLDRVAGELEALGGALHDGAGRVDLREDIRDAIIHHALEDLAVAQASPFADLEDALGALRSSFNAASGEVSLVRDVMDAVAAARKSDFELELPFSEETRRLRALGEEIRAHAPRADLLDPVLAEVATRRGARVLAPMRARPAAAGTVRVAPANWRASRFIVGLAAAACAILAAIGLYARFTQERPEAPQVTERAGGPEGDAARENEEMAALRDIEFPVADPGSVVMEPPISDAEPQESRPRMNEREPLTLQEVINARRRDLVNDTRAVAALAALTEDEAVELLKSMDLSVEALIGATQFLSVDEAIAVLRAAIAENPDDPHLRYALAQNLAGDPGAALERQEHLARLATTDGENGLPHYLMASDYLARGETALGLDALSRGSAYNESSAYALEAARQREAAFIASGLDRDVARFLALAGAGDAEYGDIATLRNELLDYGAHYEEMGEFETARQIYNAVNQLGQQIAVGADLAVERQSGLETQQEAILAIQGIAEAFQDPEIVAFLGNQLANLASGIANVTHYISARQDMVMNPATASRLNWPALLDRMITSGDLDIGDFLN